MFKEWKDARSGVKAGRNGENERNCNARRWHPPEPGGLKLNADASFFPGVETFLFVSLCHVRKQTNRVAHSPARFPCSLNGFIIFSFPSTHLVETIWNDLIK